MKKFLLSSLIILLAIFFVPTQSVQAQMGSMMGVNNDEIGIDNGQEPESNHGEPVPEVLQDILTKQNLNSVQDLDCQQVSDHDFARLGDAVMEQQHPGEAHEAMDQMMGGEDSESLEQMHINMGQAYLGCQDNYGLGMMGNSGMMGFTTLGGYHLLASLTWISLIVFLLSGTYFFIKKSQSIR